MDMEAMVEALRPMMIAAGRENLRAMLTPLCASPEKRAQVDARVAAISDEHIEEIWANYAEAAERRCPECGRPYDDEDA